MMIFCSKQRILKSTEIPNVIINHIPIGSVRSGYPVEGAAALGFRARILRSSTGMK